jgi:hypothetical protein
LERVKGIEPSYSAWKAAALPLSYTREPADHLSCPASGLNRYALDRSYRRNRSKNALSGPVLRRGQALNIW